MKGDFAKAVGDSLYLFDLQKEHRVVICYKQIARISIRKPKVGDGATIGFVVGLVAGISYGVYEDGQHPYGISRHTASNFPANIITIAGYGIVGAIGGTAAGAIIGATAGRTFKINGDVLKYEEFLTNMSR